MGWLDAKFVHRPRIYILQSLLVGLAFVGILTAEDAITNGAVVAAIASSVTIVFLYLTHWHRNHFASSEAIFPQLRPRYARFA